jgi:hypothetical protein
MNCGKEIKSGGKSAFLTSNFSNSHVDFAIESPSINDVLFQL